MYNNKGKNVKLEWHFDKRSKNREQEYLNAIKDEIKNGKGGKVLRNALDLGIEDKVEAWNVAKKVIFDELDKGFIQVVSD